MTRSGVLPRVAWLAVTAACGAGPSSGQGASGSSSVTGTVQGGSSGFGLLGQGAGVSAGSGGGAGAIAGMSAGAGASGGVGSTGTLVSSGSGGASGSSGTSSGASDAGTLSAPTPDASLTPEAGPSPATGDSGHSNKVLIYTATTGFRHASIPAAAKAIATAATAAGLVPVLSPDPNSAGVPVPADFATGALASYGAVVLLADSGYALGTPGTTQIQTLVDFVEGGGGLVGIEDATHCYDSAFPPAVPSYISLLGGDFSGHTGFGPGTCATVGSHPTNAMLPATFAITDEVYFFTQLGADIKVVLECENPGAAPRPISWVRTQGSGRVFYTALGHADASWTTGPLVPDHVLPALLWTMGR
jgi:hypothetical protein